jgi:hypothetical protein
VTAKPDDQFHFRMKAISRATGRSVVAAAAYRSGSVILDERTGLLADFTRKRGVAYSEIFAPNGVTWAWDRCRLWNAVEAASARKNANLATEFELAICHLLPKMERENLIRGFAMALVAEYGCAVDVNIHHPHAGNEEKRIARSPTSIDLPGGDLRNVHAHILVSAYAVTLSGLGQRVRIGTGPADIVRLRTLWAVHCNAAYQRAGIDLHADPRSYADQGRQEEPTRHLGPTVIEMERRSAKTVRGAVHRARTERRRAGIAIDAFDGEISRRIFVNVASATEGRNQLTPEQWHRRAKGYKRRLLTGHYGQFDDIAFLAGLVHRLDLDHDDGPRVYLQDGSKISDHGERITVNGAWLGRGVGHADPTDAAVMALVTLAKTKGWESIQLHGDDAFKRRAARAATRAGLGVANPELADIVSEEQRRMTVETVTPKGTSRLQPEAVKNWRFRNVRHSGIDDLNTAHRDTQQPEAEIDTANPMPAFRNG